MRKVLTCTIIMLFTICFGSSSMLDSAIVADGKETVSMDISPHGILYEIDNMKPGDWAPRTVTIENTGARDLDYLVEIEHDSPDKLFQELLMEVEAGNEKIYDEKIAIFTDFPPRELKTGQTEALEFTIRFPEHLGNDYQGLHTDFSLLFSAKDTENDGVLPVATQGNASSKKDAGNTNTALDDAIGSDEKETLPETATNIFNFLIAGTVLVMTGIILAAYNQKKH